MLESQGSFFQLAVIWIKGQILNNLSANKADKTVSSKQIAFGLL